MRTHSLVVAVLLLIAPACSDDDKGASESVPRMQVVFDYSPTLSDSGALLYLASSPSVELLAVTLPGTGEADCEPGVRITRELLTLAGAADVAIGCGRNTPLVGDRDWPDEWRAASNSYGEGLLPGVADEPVVDAEQLLADTLRAATEPVTLVAVGPLTNLGVVLGDQPDLVDHVARIIIMGGALNTAGNVADAPAAEWNIYVDPEAARRVIAAGTPVTFVALDATNYLPWNDRLLARLDALDTAAADFEFEVAASAQLDGIYLWDELAAMVTVDPTLVTTESVALTIDDDGAFVRDSDGFTVDVAITADTSRALDAFVTGLNEGEASESVGTLTADELDYMVQLGGIDSRFNIEINRVFQGLDENDPDLHGTAASLLEGFFAAAEGLLTKLQAIDPPASLDDAHSEYVAALKEFVERREDVLATVAKAEGETLNEVLDNTLTDLGITDIFERSNAACRTLLNYSFVRNGPRPCSLGT